MRTDTTPVELLFEKASHYLNTSIALYKLKIVESATDMLAQLITYFLFFTLLLLAILFGSMAIAIWINVYSDHQYLGFILVAAFYLLLAILVILFKTRAFKNPLQNKLILKTETTKDQVEL